MAAPTPTTRQTPTGRRIPDGYITKITFTTQPALGVWEKQVKPPGMDGGEPIDISTMHNVKFHTMYPRSLVKMGATTAVCGYDPDTLDVLLSLLNVPDTLTVLFPDGSTWCYFAALTNVEFSEHQEGEFPTVTLTITPMNYDWSTNFVEAAPVLTKASGT